MLSERLTQDFETRDLNLTKMRSLECKKIIKDMKMRFRVKR